ncbi:MAG: SWI/SNF and RSC complex component Rsc8/Ssr2 [Amphiamblys sp. WSBS2006]|nr:MAG: SWI/SNF and RSC complex component Rsc8/Ssr2 [Amphiamblys sp. WSBS2006]
MEENTYLVPSYSLWFDADKVHDIERRVFLDVVGTENEEEYRSRRNKMIEVYRGRKEDYMTVSECRQKMGGDVCMLMRIHIFLEQWGLINYQVSVERRPRLSDTEKTKQWKIFTGEIVPGTNISPGSVSEEYRHKKLKLGEGAVLCVGCGRECGALVYYRCIKKDGVDVCADCFSTWNIPEGFFGVDFVRVDELQRRRGKLGEWTEEEERRLFAAIEEHGKDTGEKKEIWSFVSGAVKTKSKEECMLHFLRMPLDDPFSDENAYRLIAARSQVADKKRIPFSETDNPVLSVLAFLASFVSPNVSSAAAKAVLEEIAREKKDGVEFDDLKERMTFVAGTAVGVAQGHAGEVAEQYSRRVEEKVAELIEVQTRKIELKMTQLEEMESNFEKERKELEEQRMQLFLERFNMRRDILRMSKEARREQGPPL